MSSLPTAFKDYMHEMVKETIEHRERHNVVRKDFIQCLIQLRNTGKVNIDDSLWGCEAIADATKSMTIKQCAGQVALLYLAGFDTTASAMANTLYELTQNPDLMKRLQRDIDETLTKHNGIISYEAIQEITLLDLCVQGKSNGRAATMKTTTSNMEFFGMFSIIFRIGAQVSDIAIVESHLHRRLQNTEFEFNRAKRNTNYHIVIGSVS